MPYSILVKLYRLYMLLCRSCQGFPDCISSLRSGESPSEIRKSSSLQVQMHTQNMPAPEMNFGDVRYHHLKHREIRFRTSTAKVSSNLRKSSTTLITVADESGVSLVARFSGVSTTIYGSPSGRIYQAPVSRRYPCDSCR